jgi:hypothetical protein
MQKIADHQDYKQPTTIDDPASLIELAEVLKSPAHMLAWGVAPRSDDQGLAPEEGSPSEHATGGRN